MIQPPRIQLRLVEVIVWNLVLMKEKYRASDRLVFSTRKGLLLERYVEEVVEGERIVCDVFGQTCLLIYAIDPLKISPGLC
jgi:hypothetical protein